MSDDATPAGADTGADQGTNDGNPAAAALEAGGTGAWTDALPEDLRSDESITKYKSIEEFAKGYKNVVGLVGKKGLEAPSKDSSLAEWNGWDALGVPKEAEKYVEAIKRPELPDGIEYDAAAEQALIETAVKNRMPVEHVQAVLDIATEMRVEAIKAEAEQAKAAELELNQKMESEWGAQKDVKLDLARRAAKHFSLDDSALDALEKSAGSFGMLEMFAKIGETMKEGRMVTGDGSGFGVSKESALAELKQLQSDPDNVTALMDKRHPKHKELTEQRRKLQQAAYG